MHKVLCFVLRDLLSKLSGQNLPNTLHKPWTGCEQDRKRKCPGPYKTFAEEPCVRPSAPDMPWKLGIAPRQLGCGGAEEMKEK